MNDKGLMGIEPPGYNGVIRFGQQPIQVQNGIFTIGRRRFYVEDDGKVSDENNNEIAQVRNGQLAPMQQQGPGQGQQPQQMPPQGVA